jgi:plastocyanin
MKRFLLLFVVLLAGCGSNSSSNEGSSTAASANTVEVIASDFKFDPGSLSVDAAGKTTFRLTNNGGTTHALEIEGHGVEEETKKIGPGESADVTVDLKAGEYEFYCPVGNHRSLGMEGKLVVGGQAAAGGGATTTGETDTSDGSYGG